MARRMDWERAARYERFGRAKPAGLSNAAIERMAKRHDALVDFALKHNLECFSCGGTAPWAKSGISLRGPWIICVACVNKPHAARPA